MLLKLVAMVQRTYSTIYEQHLEVHQELFRCAGMIRILTMCSCPDAIEVVKHASDMRHCVVGPRPSGAQTVENNVESELRVEASALLKSAVNHMKVIRVPAGNSPRRRIQPNNERTSSFQVTALSQNGLSCAR